MLTNIQIRNFKRFTDVNFELGQSVVLIGPNNSGKTTSLQALALWQIGVRHWLAKRGGGKSSADKRPGVTINRQDLNAIPIPEANLLWRDLHVRSTERDNGEQRTTNIRIEIVVEGITAGKIWTCGLEFDYANEESFYCRPLRLTDEAQPPRMPVPAEATEVKIAFLPPMSGLADREFIKQTGEIGFLIGQGQTAQVLRNLCWQIYTDPADGTQRWQILVEHLYRLFGVTLSPPRLLADRSQILMTYREPTGVELDLSSSGRGLQQTLLLLSYLYANPGTVLLLDEPDAHLEILRQRQIYQLLTETARAQGSQIIAASHSEVVLNEAADRDVVIAFIGHPHRIDDRGSQVLKALKELGFDQYYQAEQTGWVLYLEGSTDLSILQAFAESLQHPAASVLERPFVHYIVNQPQRARDHFFGLREAKPDLAGLALFDRLDRELRTDSPLRELMWRRRELENYLTREDVLLAYARHELRADDLFQTAEATRRETAMREAIVQLTDALRMLRRTDPWSPEIKATDDFLDPLFARYFELLGLPNLLRKTDYHILARLVPADAIDPEINEKLGVIWEVAQQACPRGPRA
jgi:energy-coupling factor transporter ATP-binding protein EcfA2